MQASPAPCCTQRFAVPIGRAKRWPEPKSQAERSDGSDRFPLPGPLCPRRGAQWTGRRGEPRASTSDSSCLSERSERSERSELHDAPRPRAPQVARSVSAGSGAPGSPSLWLLSLGETRESDCPAGGTSRLQEHAPTQWVLAKETSDRCEEVGASPPHPDSLFLLRQEKEAKEGDPGAPVPPLRSGQPAVLALWAASCNSLCSLRSLRSDKHDESEVEAQGALAQPMALRSSAGAQGEFRSGPSLRSATPLHAYADVHAHAQRAARTTQDN